MLPLPSLYIHMRLYSENRAWRPAQSILRFAVDSLFFWLASAKGPNMWGSWLVSPLFSKIQSKKSFRLSIVLRHCILAVLFRTIKQFRVPFLHALMSVITFFVAESRQLKLLGEARAGHRSRKSNVQLFPIGVCPSHQYLRVDINTVCPYYGNGWAVKLAGYFLWVFEASWARDQEWGEVRH